MSEADELAALKAQIADRDRVIRQLLAALPDTLKLLVAREDAIALLTKTQEAKQ